MKPTYLSLASLVLLMACGGSPEPPSSGLALVVAEPRVEAPAGTAVRLSWQATPGLHVEVAPRFGSVDGNSALFVVPPTSTTYTFTGTDAEGRVVKATAEVQVTGSWPATFRIDKQSMLEDLRKLSHPDMGGRLLGSTGGAQARTFLKAQLVAMGLRVEEQSWTYGGRTGVNLLATLPGRGATGRTVLLGAHYDHVGSPKGQVVCGADDNASGSAAVLALARVLSVQPLQDDVLLALWDGEEAGLLGAEAFTANPRIPLSQIAWVLNLDMISRQDHGALGVIGAGAWPGVLPMVRTAASAWSLRTDENQESLLPYSDQYAFHQKGIRTLFLCDVDHPDYHTVRDRYEAIHPDFYHRVTETALSILRALDGAALPPRLSMPAEPQWVPGEAPWIELPWLQPVGRVF